MQELDKWNKELERLSAKSYKEVDQALFKFYKQALKDLKSEIKNYIENYEMLSFSKRLEAERQIKVANDIDRILKELESKTDPTIRDYVKEEAESGYYGTWYAMEGANNMQVDFSFLNERYIESLVNKKVAGKNFSKRLYQHRTQLANNVTRELLNGAVKGEGYAMVAKRVGELTEANYKQALRIARTEGGRVQSTAKQKAYEEAEAIGVELEKRWLATLDKKTRTQHQILDGQTVGIDEKFKHDGYEADGPRLFGNASLDVNCRCTTIGIVSGIAPSLRKDNESKEVIKYKNYNDWLKAKEVGKK